jgi:g-D-glutamyl-meso-diaminopimelate peptidase
VNSYFDLQNKLDYFARSGARVSAIGKSECGLPIKCVSVGSGNTKIIVVGAIHAREFITATLCARQIEYALTHPTFAQIHFIPCANPDGAILYGYGDGYFGSRAEKIRKINGSADYSLYKANANGVDLNTNFPARWGTGAQNRFTPSSESYIGNAPLDQAESKALADFTEKIKPNGTLSYHAKGQIAYWYFHQKSEARDEKIARKVADKLGYKLGKSYTDSAGGYKDFCIEKYQIFFFAQRFHPRGWNFLTLPSSQSELKFL